MMVDKSKYMNDNENVYFNKNKKIFAQELNNIYDDDSKNKNDNLNDFNNTSIQENIFNELHHLNINHLDFLNEYIEIEQINVNDDNKFIESIKKKYFDHTNKITLNFSLPKLIFICYFVIQKKQPP